MASGRPRPVLGPGSTKSPWPPEVRTRRSTCGEEIDREAAAEGHRRNGLERLADVFEGLLHGQSEQDDPGHHRQVEVAVDVARKRGTGGAGDPREQALGDDRGPVEVRPPERRRYDDPEQRGRHDSQSERYPRSADADCDDRLADRDDHDQAVPLREVTRRHAPAAAPADEHSEVVDGKRSRPEHDSGLVLEKAGGDDQDGADRRRRHHAQDCAQQVMVAPRGDGIQRDVHRPDDEVGDPEQHAVVVERLRHGQRDDQHRPHRREHGDPHHPFLGVERVRQPRIRGPGPPERTEDEHAAQQASPGRVGREEARDLGDPEDEDEIEEELERGYPLLAVDVGRLHGFSRARSCRSPPSSGRSCRATCSGRRSGPSPTSFRSRRRTARGPPSSRSSR